jgi:hypothetical protein
MVDERDQIPCGLLHRLPFTKEMRDRTECGMQPWTLCLIQLNVESTHLAQQPEGFLEIHAKEISGRKNHSYKCHTIPTNELVKDFRHAL